MSLSGSCHCGAISFTAPAPEWLTDCNCSVCRRNGGLWAHFSPRDVKLKCEPERTVRYVWGDKMLTLISCATCGGTTHWEPIDPTLDRMAVNARMCDPGDIAGIRIRRFDGANSWKFLD